jgi:hypothetical protein
VVKIDDGSRIERVLLHVGFMSNITWLDLPMHYHVGACWCVEYAGEVRSSLLLGLN